MDSFCVALFAMTLFFEAGGEPALGVNCVADVICNRAVECTQHTNREAALTHVMLKPKQFSCWNNRVPTMELYEKLCKANPATMFKMVMVARLWEQRFTETNVDYRPLFTQATHYHNIHIHPWWSLTYKFVPVKTVGNHVFYKEKK